MSRDIKFRAWIKNNKRMEMCIEVNPFYIGDCDRFHWKHEEVELMQYTGLKDKNGNEIYEGDILEFVATKTKWIVSYSHGAFVISYQNSNINILYDCSMENGKLTHMKILGNKYESPELLESEVEQ